MTHETVELLDAHHKECGGKDLVRSSVPLDGQTGDHYAVYRCLKCGHETRESLERESPECQKKAA